MHAPDPKEILTLSSSHGVRDTCPDAVCALPRPSKVAGRATKRLHLTYVIPASRQKDSACESAVHDLLCSSLSLRMLAVPCFVFVIPS